MMQENPLFADAVRDAMDRLRDQHLSDTFTERNPEPVPHTWAQRVAWAELRRLALERAVWEWIIDANDGVGGDVDDLIVVMERHRAECPPELHDSEED